MRFHRLCEFVIFLDECLHIFRRRLCSDFSLVEVIIDDRDVHNIIYAPLLFAFLGKVRLGEKMNDNFCCWIALTSYC